MRLFPLASCLAFVLLLAGKVEADAPVATSFFPGGGRIGEAVTVEAKGDFKSWPVEARVDREGVTFVAGEEAGTFKAEIACDANPGIYWVRLFNEEGASSLRPFIVGSLPEIQEAEPNDSDSQAQDVDPAGLVINGRLEKAGDLDSFAVPLESGQTLVASIEAFELLGSPMDAVLQVVSPDGFVIDHVDDAPTFDPKLAFKTPTDGTYIVRVFAFPSEPDSSIRFSAGADHVYRLTLTTGDVIDLAHPSAINQDECEPRLSGVGWSGEHEPGSMGLLRFPDEGGLTWNPEHPGFARINVVDLPVIRAEEASEEPASLPVLICGRLEAEGSRDRFRVKGEPGSTVALRVEARVFSSPLDPVVRVENSSGEELAEQDDSGRSRDPELTVKVPDDGILVVEMRDLHKLGGPRFLYRVEVREPAPEVALSVESDNVVGSKEKPPTIPVVVDRRGGFKDRVTISVEGLPEGVTAEPVVSEADGDSAKKVTLALVTDGTTNWSGEVRIIGSIDGSEDGDSTRVFALADRIGGPPTSSLWLTITSTP